MNSIIIYIGICLSILSGIVYIRNHEYRYWLILLYLLLLIYGFYNINKEISLGGLLVFFITYLFIAKKPEFKNIEHYKDADISVDKDTNESYDKDVNESFDKDANESFDKDANESVDKDGDESVDKDTFKDKKESQENEKSGEDYIEEKGIEQFGLADKFSQLHNLIHQMEKQTKK